MTDVIWARESKSYLRLDEKGCLSEMPLHRPPHTVLPAYDTLTVPRGHITIFLAVY